MARELESEPDLSAQAQEATFGLYCAEVDAEEERQEASRSEPAERRPSKGYTRKGKVPERRRPIVPAEGGVADGPSDPSSSDGSESGTDRHTSKKRRRLREREMPWSQPEADDVRRAYPSCTKTVALLRLFNRDIKGAKFFVSIVAGAPDNVPASQWEQVLKGEPVDLDHILSSLNRTTVTEVRTGRVGDADIVFGPVEATRKAATAANWSAVWRKAARAIRFVFPHRADELDAYAEYIEDEYAAEHPGAHSRIVQYDIAVRSLVRGGPTCFAHRDSQVPF